MMYLSILAHSLHFKKIDSTQKYLKKNYKQYPNMMFVSTDFQTMGKGRNTRTRVSESKANLLFSFLIKDKKLVQKFDVLSVLSAVSIKQALEEIGLKNVSIKWPNDVYVNGKKICGILLEGITKDNKLDAVVIGIGLNVNQDNFPTDLLRTPTSIKKEIGEEISIKKVKKIVYKQIVNNFENIESSNYLSIARSSNYLKNKEVYAEINNAKKLVKVLDINDDNSLKVEVDGKIFNIKSGEITFHL